MTRFAAISPTLASEAKAAGYYLELRPTRRVRGWPVESAKPFALYRDAPLDIKGLGYVASFATVAQVRAYIARNKGESL